MFEHFFAIAPNICVDKTQWSLKILDRSDNMWELASVEDIKP